MNPNYQPARDEDAEWSVLSAVFTEPTLLERDREGLTNPDNYWQPVGKEVAKAIRKGVPLDAVAMGQHVTEKLGNGAVGLFSEKVLCGSVAVATFGFWLERLKRAAARRRIQESAYAALLAVEDKEADIDKVAGGLVDKVRTLGFSRNGLPDIQSATELDSHDIPEPDELIAGLLHKGCKMVLGGTSKSMKTWTLLQLAICCAAGLPFWDMQTRRSRVLFLNFEIQQYSFRERIRHICRALRIPIPSDQLFVWNLRGHSADLSNLRPRIVEHIRLGEFGIICLDPIYKLYGERDENAASQMAGLMNEIDSIAVETNASVVFGHHFSKAHGVKAGIDKMSGSGVFARDPDSIFVIHPHEEDDVLIVEPTLRDFSPIDPFCIQWEFPLMKRTAEYNPDQAKSPDGQRRAYQDGSILMCIQPQGSTFKDIFDAAHKSLEIPKGTLSRYLSRLVKAGKIVREKTQFGEIYKTAEATEKVAF